MRAHVAISMPQGKTWGILEKYDIRLYRLMARRSSYSLYMHGLKVFEGYHEAVIKP